MLRADGLHIRIGGVGLSLSQTLLTAGGGLFSICALSAMLELICRDEAAVMGFRSACGLAIALSALRFVLTLMKAL